jgi:hypothetical protein
MMGLAASLMLTCCQIHAGGCSQQGSREDVHLGKKGAQHDSDGRPTITEAKEALLAALKSKEMADLSWVDPVELIQQAERPAGTDGTLHWGPFRINLRDKTFSYTVVYGPDRKCAITTAGHFVAKWGRWTAY